MPLGTARQWDCSYLRADLQRGAELQPHVVQQVLFRQEGQGLTIDRLLAEYLRGNGARLRAEGQRSLIMGSVYILNPQPGANT